MKTALRVRLVQLRSKLARGTLTKEEYDEFVAIDGYPPGQRPLRYKGQHRVTANDSPSTS